MKRNSAGIDIGIKPYFETELGRLYCADCEEVMREIPNKSVDLILTDPPYGVEKVLPWDDRDNFIAKIDSWLSLCMLTAKTVLWFCAGSMLSYILCGREKDFHRLLVWDKPEGSQFAGAIDSNLWYSCEFIVVFGEHPPNDSTKSVGYSSFRYRTVAEKTFGHPTTKPLPLIQKLLYFYSNFESIVIDPFLGSGTTAVAAENMGRRWIGIEKDEKYCKIAMERIKKEARQMKLFETIGWNI